MIKLVYKYVSIFLLWAIVLTFTACGGAKEQPTQPQTSANISFVDDEGRQINADVPFERIIPLYSAHVENLYELGVGDKLIGRYKSCVYPPEVVSLETFSYKGDPEAVIAADPDLVLIRPFITKKVPDYVAALENAGITVVSLYPESYDKFPEYIQMLAMLTGSEDIAKEKLAEFYKNIDDITKITDKVDDKQTVFFESTENNIRTVSAGSMVDRAINFAGGLNLADGLQANRKGGTIAEFGVEKVLEHADDIDVYISQRGAMNAGGNIRSIGERPGYDTIKAIKNGRVHLINEKMISSPTFRYYKGVREIARFLYPDIMDDISDYQNDEIATKEDYANIVVKMKHIPVYIPSSSKYYDKEHRTHIFGLFEDIKWNKDSFDYIESAVNAGYVDWVKKEDQTEWFYPDENVTREQLAKTVFLVGNFKNIEDNLAISDLNNCEKPKIIQILVDNGIFDLEDGNFNPERFVTNKEVIKALSFVTE